MQKLPELFKPPKIPLAWKNEDIDVTLAHSEAPMHLLFLGHCKNLLKFIISFLKSRHQDTTFRNCLTVSGILSTIGAWNLDWCAALDFGNGSFGGFISENFLGTMRLLPWLVNIIAVMCYDDALDNELPNAEIMTTTQLRNWLKRRGSIACNDENRDVMLLSFYQMKEDIHEHPIVESMRTCTMAQLLQVVRSLFILTSSLMSATNESCQNDDEMNKRKNLVKLYLSSYLDAESSINPNRNGASWTTKPNMTGLFNLVRNMSVLGVPRALWEGGKMGEGTLPSVKPHINGLRKNWQDISLKRIAQDKSFSLIDKMISKSDDCADEVNNDIHCIDAQKEFATYSNLEQFRTDMKIGKPLTGFICGNTLHILVKDKYNQTNDEGKCHVIEPVVATCECHCGFAYFEFITCNDVDWYTIRKSKDIVGVIMLPLLNQKMLLQMSNQESFKGVYSVIASDWRSMICDGTFGPPDHFMNEIK